MAMMRHRADVIAERDQALAVAKDHDVHDDVDVASYFLGVAAGLTWAVGGPWPAPSRTVDALYTRL